MTRIRFGVFDHIEPPPSIPLAQLRERMRTCFR